MHPLFPPRQRRGGPAPPWRQTALQAHVYRPQQPRPPPERSPAPRVRHGPRKMVDPGQPFSQELSLWQLRFEGETVRFRGGQDERFAQPPADAGSLPENRWVAPACGENKLRAESFDAVQVRRRGGKSVYFRAGRRVSPRNVQDEDKQGASVSTWKLSWKSGKRSDRPEKRNSLQVFVHAKHFCRRQKSVVRIKERQKMFSWRYKELAVSRRIWRHSKRVLRKDDRRSAGFFRSEPVGVLSGVRLRCSQRAGRNCKVCLRWRRAFVWFFLQRNNRLQLHSVQMYVQ